MIYAIIFFVLIYVATVILYANKLIGVLVAGSRMEIKALQRKYADRLAQQERLLLDKKHVEGEAIKIFTLYDMTKEITQSLNQNDAFEIFKLKLSEHVHCKECSYFPEEAKEVEKYQNNDDYFIFRLKSKNKKMGYLVIDLLDKTDKEKAMILCHQYALALRRVKLYQEIEQTAITDSLTEVYTRRYTLQRLLEELNRSKARKISMAILMIDVDHFKGCNDKYGHLVGDQILREVGVIIKNNIREIDIPGRFGGEEFCIVLPDTDLRGAQYAAERIRTATEKKVIRAYDAKLSITVSIGIATYPADAKSRDELIDKADWTLYKAKKQGRNRVCIFEQ